ncbi:MAG: 5'/3'-nucleotidase SurE [Terriglobia bacterium]
MIRLLLTNDDGILSPGIIALEHAFAKVADVTVVAPNREMSATSHALTIHRPVRYEEISHRRFAVDGTPADCVLLALNYLLPVRPDLVISGINKGPNLGRDVGYSGTVAGAIEAAYHDLPAFAISLAARSELRFEEAAQFAVLLAQKMRQEPLANGMLLNVNVPAGEIRGVRITVQGKRNIQNLVIEERDPRGRKYFWFDQRYDPSPTDEDPASDYAAIAAHCVSITPIEVDRTGYGLAESMAHWPEQLSKEKVENLS